MADDAKSDDPHPPMTVLEALAMPKLVDQPGGMNRRTMGFGAVSPPGAGAVPPPGYESAPRFQWSPPSELAARSLDDILGTLKSNWRTHEELHRRGLVSSFYSLIDSPRDRKAYEKLVAGRKAMDSKRLERAEKKRAKQEAAMARTGNVGRPEAIPFAEIVDRSNLADRAEAIAKVLDLPPKKCVTEAVRETLPTGFRNGVSTDTTRNTRQNCHRDLEARDACRKANPGVSDDELKRRAKLMAKTTPAGV